MFADWQDVEAHHTSDVQVRDWYGLPDAPRRTTLLDKPSEPHPILSMLMDDALRQIMLTGDGAVAALKVRVTGSKDPTTPVSSLSEMVELLGRDFMKCKTHRQRLKAIKEVQAILDRLRYAPRSEMRGTAEWKAVIGRDERPCRVVASVYRVSLRDVVSYRKTYR